MTENDDGKKEKPEKDKPEKGPDRPTPEPKGQTGPPQFP